jgi:hypothetical protein
MDRVAICDYTSLEPGRTESPSSQRPRMSRRALAQGGPQARSGHVAPWLRADAEPAPVTLGRDWMVNGAHAGYFRAPDRGSYAEHGHGGGALRVERRPETRA